MVGGIFLLEDSGHLIEMTEEVYASEDLLQELLASHPSLLAGDQINPTEPRNWLLISREMGIPSEENGTERWSVDHLFLDQDATPTLVEVKRSSDTRLRREVVGQLLEYAANAGTYWSLERIQTTYQANCAAMGIDSDQRLADFMPDEDQLDDFWLKVKTNLQAGRIRLIFLADEIPQELRQIVEFLNLQMDPAEVLAVEVKQYAGGGKKTLVPRVFGQTAATQYRKSGGKTERRKWDEESFFSVLKEKAINENVLATARTIYDWSKNKFSISWGQGKENGSFTVTDADTGLKLIYVWTGGGLHIAFDSFTKTPPFDLEQNRITLLEKINQIPNVDIPEDAINRSWGGQIELTQLVDDSAREKLFECLEWAVDQARKG